MINDDADFYAPVSGIDELFHDEQAAFVVGPDVSLNVNGAACMADEVDANFQRGIPFVEDVDIIMFRRFLGVGFLGDVGGEVVERRRGEEWSLGMGVRHDNQCGYVEC